MVNKGKTAAETDAAFQDTLVVWVRADLFSPAGGQTQKSAGWWEREVCAGVRVQSYGCGHILQPWVVLVTGKLRRAVELLFFPLPERRARGAQCVPSPETALCSSGRAEMANANLKSQAANAHLISVLLHCKLATA